MPGPPPPAGKVQAHVLSFARHTAWHSLTESTFLAMRHPWAHDVVCQLETVPWQQWPSATHCASQPTGCGLRHDGDGGGGGGGGGSGGGGGWFWRLFAGVGGRLLTLWGLLVVLPILRFYLEHPVHW